MIRFLLGWLVCALDWHIPPAHIERELSITFECSRCRAITPGTIRRRAGRR